MRLFTWAGWLPVTAFGGVLAAAANTTSGIVEVDLAFPRNDTYEPTPLMPVVFAIQNPELAQFLNLGLSFTIWDYHNQSETVVTGSFALQQENLTSSDPYFAYRGFEGFNKEGFWWITWRVGWDNCTEESLTPPIGDTPFSRNYSGGSIYFTTKSSAQAVDLVNATESTDNCSEDMGVAANVTNILQVPDSIEWTGGDTCAEIATSTPTADPCKVKIDAVAASSMSSTMSAWLCTETNSSISCPPEDAGGESIAQQVAVGGLTCLLSILGALGYMMV